MSTFISTESSLRREILARLAAGAELADAARLGVTAGEVRAVVEGGAVSADSLARWLVRRFMRPALPLVAGSFEEPEARWWHRQLSVAGKELTRGATAVGRIELRDHPATRWEGSCWLVSRNTVVTTRVVASRFCRAARGRMTVGLLGIGAKAVVRFEGLAPIGVKDVLISDGAGAVPDLAFLVLESTPTGIEPVALATEPPKPSAALAAIGYAGGESRSGSEISALLYRGAFHRKCVAPGRARVDGAGTFFAHDCGTIDDWGGALLLDLASGRAAGIHVVGGLDQPGAGVHGAAIADAMKAVGLAVPAAPQAPLDEEALEARRRTARDYADRAGYQSRFIGIDVTVPKAREALRDDVLMFRDADGEPTPILAYTHFSVCMSKSRRMCLYTACNVHGGKLLDLPRSGIEWTFDARFEREQQAGNDLYVDNDLDRGHMVRRLDPVWGDEAEAANADTFHYTNSCPQHKDLNQKTWNNLEDYILKNAGKHELLINVFTGPIYRPDDMEYRGFQVPSEFWKIVTMVKDDGRLSATAYKLSQVDLITGLEFVYGRFRTYQVRIRDIEDWTQLDFGDLRNWDPKDAEEGLQVATPIEGPDDVVI